MGAKMLYTKSGSDPNTITWPPNGPPNERYQLTSGTAATIPDLIGYGDGTATYPDGRLFPPLSAAGSTFVHQKS